MPTDPVCGMYVPEDSSLFTDSNGQKIYFCSTGCYEKYTLPEKSLTGLRHRLIVGWLLAIPIIVMTYGVSPDLLYRNYLIFLLAIPVQIYSGSGFYEGAVASIRMHVPNMDLLVSLGTVTAFSFSTFVTFFPGVIAPSSGVYFDASAFIIVLILSGNYIENMTKARANSAASKLTALIPERVRVIRDGQIQEIGTGDLKTGDTVLVRTGETVPVDGTIKSGKCEVDESAITGEQIPVVKGPEDRITSGSVLVRGTVEVFAERTGRDTTVSQILEMIQKASSGRLKIQRLADAFSELFVPVVIAVALVSSLFWLIYLHFLGFSDPVQTAILVFVSVVVIACPCAIGLAAPITMLISSGLSSERGIVIKNTRAFDRLTKISTVIFDKTGTLTKQHPTVSQIRTSGEIDENTILKLAGSIESYSSHPVAKALVAFADRRGISLSLAQKVVEIPGVGIEGEVEGHHVSVVRSEGADERGVSVVVDRKKTGWIDINYEMRESAPRAVSRLKEMGIKVAMVTGDSESEARRIAASAGIEDVHWRILPQGKDELVRKYQESGEYVMFVGDGINDSIALESADVGVSMGSGTDIAKESGDAILIEEYLERIPDLIIIGRKTMSKIRQNIWWAFGYNSALIPVAAGILVPVFGLSIYSFLPMFSALAMGMSSSSVVTNSLMLKGGIIKEIGYGKRSQAISNMNKA